VPRASSGEVENVLVDYSADFGREERKERGGQLKVWRVGENLNAV
jgi:hypothetical protein